MKIYRVAIVGCRGRGTFAARAYHSHPRTELVGLWDHVEELVNNLGDEVSVSTRFKNLDDMILRTVPDIVVISTGTKFHYDLSMRGFEHGVHIEVEKPMCVDLLQADAVIEKANEKKSRGAVHHQGRVGVAMQSIERALLAGKIGNLRYICTTNKGYYGGCGLMNIGCHKINDMLKFAGHCRSIVAHAMTNGHIITSNDVLQAPAGMGTIAGEHII